MMDQQAASHSPQLTCFSQNHGNNVILLENNTVAYRKASFANAVTVSDQPVLPGEIFLVEIELTEPGWTGHMRLGLTQLRPTEELPLYSMPDLSNRGDSWICAITKHHNNIRKVAKEASSAARAARRQASRAVGETSESAGAAQYRAGRDLSNGAAAHESSVPRNNNNNNDSSSSADSRLSSSPAAVREEPEEEEEEEYVSILSQLSIGDQISTSRGLIARSTLLPARHTHPLPTDEGSRIGVLYLPQVNGYGEMHYIINGEDQGVFTSLLPYKEAPLYAVVDVYGATKKVRIIQPYGVVSLKSACRAAILQRIMPHLVPMLPLPPQLQSYLLSHG